MCTWTCWTSALQSGFLLHPHQVAREMIERFHRSLKSALRAPLPGSDWVHHLPLVMLGLWSAPKGEFLGHPELPLKVFLWTVDCAVSGFSGPSQHHMIPSPDPQPLPKALLTAEFMFVCDDASKPPLALLFRGPFRVLQQSDNFFLLQVVDKCDSLSVERLKPVISSNLVTPAVLLLKDVLGWFQPPTTCFLFVSRRRRFISLFWFQLRSSAGIITE